MPKSPEQIAVDYAEDITDSYDGSFDIDDLTAILGNWEKFTEKLKEKFTEHKKACDEIDAEDASLEENDDDNS